MTHPQHETRVQRYMRRNGAGSYFKTECRPSCYACTYWRAWRGLAQWCGADYYGRAPP